MDDLIISMENILLDVFNTIAYKLESTGKNEMKLTVEDIIAEWYASGGSSSDGQLMALTFDYETEVKIDKNKNSASIIFRGWSIPERYRGTSADGHEWASRHGMSDMDLYVYSLQMYSGIIGLPAYANYWESNHDYPFTGLGFVNGYNTNYRETIPLISYLPVSPLWSKWETTMASKFSSIK